MLCNLPVSAGNQNQQPPGKLELGTLQLQSLIPQLLCVPSITNSQVTSFPTETGGTFTVLKVKYL